MPTGTPRTVKEYLLALPPERRAVMEAARDLVVRHLPPGYRESLAYGMIAYEVPLERYPDTYNGQPLCYAGLAAQKKHFALYLTGAYSDPATEETLREGFRKAGKKLDMGKSCLRFRSLDDLAVEAVGRAIASLPPEKFIAVHEKGRSGATKTQSGRAPEKKAAARKVPAARAVAKTTPARKMPAKRVPSRTGTRGR